MMTESYSTSMINEPVGNNIVIVTMHGAPVIYVSTMINDDDQTSLSAVSYLLHNIIRS